MKFNHALLFAIGLSISASLDLGAQAAPSGGRAFTVEAAGGVIGSAAGAALGLAVSRVDDCGVDDLACTIQGLGAAGIGSVIGATAGTIIAGKAIRSRPSGVGSFVGSVAGAVAGVALIHGITEEANLKLEQPMTIVVYSVTQGIVTALGSRLVASLRR